MKWKILPKKSDDLVKQLLINRGITGKSDIEEFFNPKISSYKKDIEIPGIEKAQKRILEAIKKGELIIVFGDYDVDGICGCAILYKVLTSLGAKVLPYIPHREKEGYGLSNLGLEFARDSAASVVITVDNGITANKQAKFAKELGLDLIITDHHVPLNEKPDAYAIVHSTKMCGAAVAWGLVQGLISKSLREELLEFVGVATVCDLIPLTNLGRAFLVEGLRQLKKTTNLGFLSLVNECELSLSKVGSYEIGHIIGPRLNAMGRIEHAIDSLRLLCTKDPTKAKKLAKLLCETNTERRLMTSQALEEAKTLVVEENKIHVLFSEKWAAGIIGLIAGRITESYFRPSIAISVGKEISKGSARSINGINVIELIRKHVDILIDVGGHPGAAGFSILTENIEVFKKRLEEEKIILPEEKVLEIDAELSTDELTRKLVRDIQKFEPFGFGNPRPAFATTGVKVSDVRTVGNGKHLKGKVDGIDFIAFGMGELGTMIQNSQDVDIAYNLELDNYNGFEKIQLKIKDIKI